MSYLSTLLPVTAEIFLLVMVCAILIVDLFIGGVFLNNRRELIQYARQRGLI